MMYILLAGYIAIEATNKLILNEKPALSCRFSNRFLSLTDEMTRRESLSRDSICKILNEIKVPVRIEDIHEIGSMGIFGSLWNMAEENKTGLSIDLNKITVRQETVEICEWMNVNPYTYPSRGSFLIRSDRAYEIEDALIRSGSEASVIGFETDDNSRVIINNGEIRFLTPIDRLLKDEQEFKNYR